jgi:secreted trypsin-like serine protease
MAKFAVVLLIGLVCVAHSLPTTKIVGGETAERGQFPYQALLVVNTILGKAVCGGCLLSDEWVVTAGHCLAGAMSVDVHLGAQSFKNHNEEGRVVFKRVTKFTVHENYNSSVTANDIALVHLPSKVTFSSYVQPVELPKVDTAETYEGQTATASGWGIQHDNANVADELQFAFLTVISNEECTKHYNSLLVRDTTVCARGEAKESVCHGDSGGPLVLQDTNTLVGLTSFGHVVGCEKGVPAAFTRVTSYLTWLAKHTGLEV